MADLRHTDMSNHYEFEPLDPEPTDSLYQNDETQNHSTNENQFNDYFHENKGQVDSQIQTTIGYLGYNNRSECEYDDLDAENDHKVEDENENPEDRTGKKENIYKAIIKDQEHYQSLLHSRITEERNEGLQKYVDTFPKDPNVQRSWVKRIFEAILNLDDIIDKETKYHNSSSQAARRVRDGYYPEIEIEKTAWKLMLNARDAQIGVRLIDKYHGVKVEDPVRDGVGVYLTWADRMEAIINTLRVSKAACKQLMDPHYIDRVVVCPNAERQMKKNNKRINTERDIQNQLGRKLLDLKVVPIDEVEREVEKLQNIKEAHRLAIPSKTSRIKKELNNDKLPIFVATRTFLEDQERQNIRKRKKSTRQKSQTSFAASDEDFEEIGFVPENEKETSDCIEKLHDSKRQRLTGLLDNNLPTMIGSSTEKLVDFNDHSTIIGGIRVHSPQFDSNFISTDNNTCMVETSSTFDLNQYNSEIGRFQINLSVPFQFGQNLDIFQPNNPISFLQDSPTGSVYSSHQSTTQEPKIAKHYSEIICNLLLINSSLAIHFSLHDLRLYAHAYNSKFILSQWTHPALGSRIARGCCVHDENTGEKFHISRFFSKLTGIACARNDVDKNLNIIPGTEITHAFDTGGDQLMDQALGIVENPCGRSFISFSPR